MSGELRVERCADEMALAARLAELKKIAEHDGLEFEVLWKKAVKVTAMKDKVMLDDGEIVITGQGPVWDFEEAIVLITVMTPKAK